MSIGTWFKDTQKTVLGWFTPEEAAILEFFHPLMLQVKAEALKLGKDNLQVGLNILKDAAISAAMAAATAPGDKVAAAETAFLTTGASEGIVAIHNAEAGAIKAAVAIVQSTQAPPKT
jgi:hypothetical protein